MNVATVLDDAAARHPERAAIVDERAGRTISYAELRSRASSAAKAFADRGLRPGDRVAVGVPMSLDLYVALLGIWRAGLIAVVPDASSGMRALFRSVARSEARAIVLPQRFAALPFVVPDLRDARERFAFGAFPATTNLRAAKGDLACAEAADDAPALLSFTSGSTGEPKIVVRTHGILRAQLDAILANVRLGTVTLETMPIVLLANIAAGGTSVIPNAKLAAVGRIDGNRLAETISRYACETMIASPVVLDRISAATNGNRDARLASLRDVYSGGAPVFPRTLAAFAAAAPNARLHAVYGSTEAEPIAHVAYDDIGPGDVDLMKSGHGLLAGRAVEATAIEILTAAPGRALGPWSAAEFAAARVRDGEVGEIVVSGAHVVPGYDRGIGDPETKIRVDTRIWHRTGDLARRDPQGRLWLLGRTPTTPPRHPEPVEGRREPYPLAVECAMSFRPNVRRSALLKIGDDRVLAVETDDGTLPGEPPPGIDRMVVLERIPVDRRHNAKTDYPALRKLLSEA